MRTRQQGSKALMIWERPDDHQGAKRPPVKTVELCQVPRLKGVLESHGVSRRCAGRVSHAQRSPGVQLPSPLLWVVPTCAVGLHLTRCPWLTPVPRCTSVGPIVPCEPNSVAFRLALRSWTLMMAGTRSGISSGQDWVQSVQFASYWPTCAKPSEICDLMWVVLDAWVHNVGVCGLNAGCWVLGPVVPLV